MGGYIANFAKKVFNGIKYIGLTIWNGIKNAAEIVIDGIVGFVNGIKTIVRENKLLVEVLIIVGVIIDFILFSPETLLLGLMFLSYLILFGIVSNVSNNEDDNDDDEEDVNDDEENHIQNPRRDNNPNFEQEQRERRLDLSNDFLNNTQSYINDVINNPGYEPEISTLYTFTLNNDDIIAQISDSELNNEIQNVLVSTVYYKVSFHNEIKLISLSFLNDIEDIQLGKRILNKIKDQLDRVYHNNVRFVETFDDPREVELEQINDITTIVMVIKIN